MKKFISFISIILIYVTSYSQVYVWDTIKLNEFEVISDVNITKTSPFTYNNLNEFDIKEKSKSNEPAVLLSNLPSFTYHSDNGIGLGYLYFKLRGMDQSKINVTFNGIPLNEPEDHGLFFNNYSSLLKSVSNVQVIRGLGISKPGISSYGGSIEFTPLVFSKQKTFNTEILLGSYNTIQYTLKYNSKRLFLNASFGDTDGFRDNSSNTFGSGFYGYNNSYKNHKFNLYGFISKQKNQMAWLGEYDSVFKTNGPKYNSHNEKEVDKFFTFHNQLNWGVKNLKTTIYHTYLNGMYTIDNFHFGYPIEKTSIDTINLKSNLLGLNMNYKYEVYSNLSFNYGFTSYAYIREHFGDTYSNTGYKYNVSPYIKAEYKCYDVTLYGDIQYKYMYLGYNQIPDTTSFSKEFNFINWTLGVSKIYEKTLYYFAFGQSNKEPKRYDYLGGYEYYDSNIANLSLKPEKVISFETGIKQFLNRGYVNVNFYLMQFKNEIILTGEVGENSLMLSNANANKSYRAGVEVDYEKYFNDFKINLATSLSNSSVSYDTNMVTINKQLVMFPKFMSNAEITKQFKRFNIGISYKYVSKAYIDLENIYELDPYPILNVSLSFTLGSLDTKILVNNIINKNYYLNATVSPWDIPNNVPRYFPLASTNLLVIFNF